MPVLLFIVIIGSAAGFLATRFMRVNVDVPTTIAIGVAGAAVGWFALRVLSVLTGGVAYFAGAVIGASLLIWLWRTYITR
jgi:uncharacterized membrane protein YeaQ/YmgE (transglycosylase-associated protein family)